MFIRTTALTPVELRAAIVREPLVVSPDTTVMDAIAHMSGIRAICDATKTVEGQLHLEARSSCVLVVEDGRLLGIVTERDMVLLSAQQRSLENLAIREVMTSSVVTLRESAFTDLFLAINLLQQHHIRHLPIMDEQDRLVGLLTHESLRQTSRPADLLRLRLVSEVMTSEVICAAPDMSMLAIAQLMVEHRVSSVMIVESGSTPTEPLQIPVGILTERDIVQFQALGLSLETYLAQAVMSTPIFAVRPDDSLWTVQQSMEQHSIRRLAVTSQQGELLGIVTQTSLLQALNPLELYKLAEMLEQKVVRLETEKVQLLGNLLEQQVEARTTALKAKAQREKLIAELATQIRSSLSLQTILDTTVEQVRQVLGCDRVNIWQFEADWQTIAVAESTDSPLSLLGERINDTCFKQKQAEIYRQGRILVVPDIFTTKMSDCHRKLLIRLQTRAKIIVPLLCGDELWGLLNASESQHPREWQPEEIELVQALSVHLAIALQQATTHQKLQEELTERQQAEARLRESEQRYSTLAAAAPVGIFRSDAAGNCTYINDRCFEITGITTPEAIIGNGWQQALHPDDRDWVIAEWARFIQDQQPFQLEYRFQRPDGVMTWVYGQSVAERDANGQIVGYLGTVTDITDRKQAEAYLRESEERYATLVEAAPVGIFRTDAAGNCIYVNDRWCQISGLTPKTSLREGWRAGLHPDDRNAIATEWQQSIEEHRPFQLEYRFQRPDGTVTWVYGQSVAELDAEGQAIGYVGTITDISDRKQVEVAVSQLAAIVESSADAIVSKTLDGTIVSWNKGAEKLFGYQAQEVIGQSILLLIPTEFKNEESSILEKIQKGEVVSHYETVRQKKDGKLIDISLTVSPIKDATGKIVGASKIARDISDRKRAQAALIQSEAHQRALITAIPDLMMRIDRRGNYLEFVTTSSNFRVLGNLSEMVGSHVFDSLPPDVAQKRMDFIQRALEMNSIQIYEQELDLNGRKQIEEVRIVPYSEDEVLALVRDISDRKLAEFALAASEARSRAVLAAIPDLMLRVGADLVYRELVSPYREIAIFPQDFEIAGRSIAEVLPTDLAKQQIHQLQQALQTGELQIYEQQVQVGDRIQYEEIRIIKSGDDEALFMIRDISDRKLAEAALIQSEAQSRAILAAIPDFMFRIGADGLYRGNVTANRQIDVLGIDVNTLGVAMVDVISGEIATRHLHYLEQALSTGELQVYEQQVQIGDRIQYEEIRIIKSGEDEALFMIRDISDRKLAEAALIQSEAQSRAILAAIPDFMFRIGADGIYRGGVTANREIDFLPADFDTTGLAMVDVVPAEIATRHLHYLEQALRTGELQVYEQQVQIGDRLQDEEVRVVKSSEDEALFMIRDVSNRKQAERQLHQLNQQLEAKVAERTQELWQVNSLQRAILDGADYSIISTDPTGIIKTFNAGAERMLGYSTAEMVGKVTPAIIHDVSEVIDRAASLSVELGQDVPPGFEVFVAKARQGIVSEEEWNYIRKDGSRFPVSLSVTALKDANQQIMGFLGIAKDISDRKRAEAELQKLSDRLALSLKSGAIGCWEWDIVQNTLLGDERMYELFGLTKQSNSLIAYDTWVNELLHPDDRISTETLLHQAVLGQAEYDTEYRVLHPDGSIHFIKANGLVVRDAQGNPQSMIGVNFDITDRKLAEAELQKLSEHLALSLKSGAIGCWEWEIVHNIILWDERMYELYGVTKQSDSRVVYDIWANGLHPDDRISTETLLQQAVLGQSEYDTEFRVVHPDGSIHFIKAYGVVVRDAQGNPIGMTGVNFDISDRKQAELERQLLIQELSAFKLALDQSAIVAITDAQGVITYANDRFCAISGYSRDELLGQTHRIVNSGYHPPAFFQDLWRTITSGQIWRGEICNRTKNGSLYWVASTIVPFLDEGGRPFQYLAIRFDITARKLAEATLQQENTFRQQIVENMAEGLCVCHEIKEFPFVRFTVWNQQMQAITGYSLEDINRLGWHQSLCPDSEAQEQAIACVRQIRQGKNLIAQEREIQRQDGQKSTVSISTSVLSSNNGHNYVLALIQDITDRKQTEQAMTQQLAAIEAAIDGIAIMQGDTYLYLNQAHLELFGYKRPEELVGKTWKFLYSPEELERFEREVFPMLGGDRAWRGEAIATRKDGSTFTEGLSLTLTDDGLLICVCRDISKRKQIEKALQESQQFLQTILDTIPLPLFWKNRESVFLGCNHQLAKSLDLTSTSEIIGKTDFELSTTEAQAIAYRASDRRVMESGEGKLGIEETLTLPSGEQRWLETHKAPLRDWADNVIGVVGMFQDISDRKQTEVRLQQQAKQERLLGAITQRMRSSLNLDDILNTTVEEIHQVLQLDRALVYQVFPEGTGAAIAESVSPNWPKILDIVFPEEVFPQENYERYIQGRVYALSDREDENQSVLPCLIEFLTELQVRAKLVVPIVQNQTLWGLLIAHQCDRPRQWQEWEINLLKQTANQLAIAIQQANLYEQVQSELVIRKQTEEAIALQLQRQRTLGAIVQQIRESLDINQILATVTQQVKEILGGDRAIVFQLFGDGRGQIVEEAVSSELPILKDCHWDNEVWSPEILECYWQGKPRIVPDVMTDIWTNCLVEYSMAGQIQSKIVAPILQEVRSSENNRWVSPGETNKLWGVLVVHACRQKRVWQESEAQLLQQIANQLAIAIQQASLFEQLQQELTERQQAQQQITERNQQLAISNEELARATRLKDEFLANMSHELRTPLNAILGMTEGLQEQVFGIVNEPQIKALQTIERSGSHLLELINDILDVAKIESGQMELDCTPVSINRLCQSSLAFIKQQALKKRLQLEIKLPVNVPHLLIDERRIRQVLINLLNNAVKFTPEGGRITLEVSHQRRATVLTPLPLQGITKVRLYQTPLEQELALKPQEQGLEMKDYLRIAVMDTGIGIAPEHINRLFQPFIQIDSALNRQYEGTGLGLALVKRIVELHGGQVGLTSKVGLGSCFTIDLPSAACVLSSPELSSPDLESQSEPPIEPSEPEQKASPLILLAEDNEANISTVSSYLRAKGYRILLAKNGEEAIALAKSENPDLILMDIQMPGMDGLEAMQQIRRDPNLVDVPIVALTALAMTGDRDRCLAAGANDYLTKPVKLKQLAATIQQLLASHQRYN